MQRYLSERPIQAFLLLAFTLSWPFLIYRFGWFGSEQDILKRYLFSCTGMLMVALSAFITRLLIERRGLRDAGWNPGRLSWYLGALIWLVFMWLGPPVGAFVFGKLDTKRPFTSGELTVVALSFIFGALWLKSRSMLLLSFFHGYWIGIRDSVALLFSFPGVFRLVSLAVVLTGWFVAYVWLQKYERVI
jgi:hypothetical protein